MKYFSRRVLALGLVVLTLTGAAYAQKNQRITRYDLHPMHWVRFRARNIFNRNLVYTPVWNIGNFGDAGLDPGWSLHWPGSQGNSYGSYFVFFVGGIVKDMSAYRGKVIPDNWEGKEFPIVSDSFFDIYGPNTNSQLSPDRTHQCMWEPMPGFYNDGPGGWIGGINEDVNGNFELDPGEDVNGNGILDEEVEPPKGLVKSLAVSTDKRTWPTYWPPGSYIGDTRPVVGRPPKDQGPGLRAGLWNGEYGAKTIADEESYYLMDDHENDWWNAWKKEKYWPMKNPDGTPDTRDWKAGGIAGLGVEVEGRGYAWFHPLAEDILVMLYRVRNYSDYVLPRIHTGIFANANIVQSAYNQVDYIVAKYDYQGYGGRTDFDIMYQWHKFPEQLGTIKKVGVFGFAFLESPGIDYNGVDDDADSLIDESMSDGIDNDHDWKGFSDIGLDRLAPGDEKYEGPDADGTEGNGKWDTEDKNLNGALDPGEDTNANDRLDYEPVNDDVGTDGVGPDDNEYMGPDPDGTECNGVMDLGEPHFDVTDIDEADQAGLKHVYVFEYDRDILRSDRSVWEKFLRREGQEVIDSDEDIAFVFGSRGVKLDRNRWYRFCTAIIMGQDRDDVVRNKSIMQRIYNANYRFLTPPLKPTVIGQASDRKVIIYWDQRAEFSKDPFFGEDFEGYRVYKSTDPQFLDIKTITDAFGNVILFKPLAIYDKVDGLKGPHPVAFSGLGVHYDMGKDSGLKHSYKDTLVDNGRKYYYAVTSIDAGNDYDFYERGIVTIKHPLRAPPSECGFSIVVNRLGEIVYRDRNTAVMIPTQMAAGYVDPHVDSLHIKHVSGYARGGKHEIEVYNRNHVKIGNEYEITFYDDGWLAKLDSTRPHGYVRGMKMVNLTEDSVLFDIVYPNYQEFMLKGIPEIERTVYEGLHLDWTWPMPRDPRDQYHGIRIIKWDKRGRYTREWQRWTNDPECNLFAYTIKLRAEGYPLPYDFEIRVGDHVGIDTSWSQQPKFIPIYPTNFSVYNVSDPNNPEKMKFKLFYDIRSSYKDEHPEMFGQIWDSTRIVILFGPHKDRKGRTTYYSSWEVRFFKNIADSLKPVVPPKPGSIFRFRTERNPNRTDVYRFKVEGGTFDKALAKKRMEEIYVVPDPYVVSSTLESIYNIGGRSARKIEFVNLPPKCTIKIFTASGRLVRTLYHDSPVDYGRQTWDMTTMDGPEIAFGVYFYVVEAPGIGVKRGKFAVIK